MAREISRSEIWERAHQVFSQVNFNAYDFNTIKESLLDYTKIYFPENFNDFIETSEYIAILELFAYVGELLAYRIDLNAHENFITTAQRKESILRIAKLLSYKSSRNLPLRGLVKITSVQTTETIFDSVNRNLAGRKIIWFDSNNLDWKEQFLLVINKVLQQKFGSVLPKDRKQVDDTLFELYDLNHMRLTNDGKSIFTYNAQTSFDNYNMELVPVNLSETGPEERRPEYDGRFSLLYTNDGIGDSSDGTGFMLYTKQGKLQMVTNTFDGVTTNQTFELTAKNINETDVWVNNVDPSNNEILTYDPFENTIPHLSSKELRYGEWVQVDIANSQNIIYNTNINRKKYEIETLDEDKLRIIFGDGEFSDIPSGVFNIWFRTSANDGGIIQKNDIIDKVASFNYMDSLGTIQTFTFTFSLINSLVNSSVSEDIEHVRRVAPSVYYTQERMVNNRDYNMFMLQDPSILKLRTINRTFAGDSKYISWHDPKEYYENVKLFGDDLALYWIDKEPIHGSLTKIFTPISSEQLVLNYLQPYLYSTDIFSILAPKMQEYGLNPRDIRKVFNTNVKYYYHPTDPNLTELDSIIIALNDAAINVNQVDLYYSVIYDEWTVGPHPLDFLPGTPESSWTGSPFNWPGYVSNGGRGVAESIKIIEIFATFSGSILSGWEIRWRTKRLICESMSTKFWHTNTTNKQINYNTMNSLLDKIVILQANADSSKTKLLTQNIEFGVIAQELVDNNLPNTGLTDIHKLSILPSDENGDGVPDNMDLYDLLDSKFERRWDEYDKYNDSNDGECLKLPNGLKINNSSGIDVEGNYEGLDADVEVYVNGIKLTFAHNNLSIPSDFLSDLVVDSIFINQVIDNSNIVRIRVKDYVYFYRETYTDRWVPVPDNQINRSSYLLESQSNVNRKYKRHPGRYKLNFGWFHVAPRYHLIDPSPSNIHDMFIITKGYFLNMRRWLDGVIPFRPKEISPMELRNTYGELLQSKMISDSVILHTGKVKVLFGNKADESLRCRFNVLRSTNTSLTNNQVKSRIVDIIKKFFDLEVWEFGETFYFTELSTVIHYELGPEIDSIVLVPLSSDGEFGDLFVIKSKEDEIFMPDITVQDIDIVGNFSPTNIRQ